jgi:hypothetical protein
MTGAVAIVLTFRAQGEAIQSIGGANGMETVFAPGEQFVDVTLMTDIPDKFVVRRGKNAVQGDGQFDNPEIRAEMPAVFGQFGDQLLAQFFGQSLPLFQRQFFDVRRLIHHVQVSAHKPVIVVNRPKVSRPFPRKFSGPQNGLGKITHKTGASSFERTTSRQPVGRGYRRAAENQKGSEVTI